MTDCPGKGFVSGREPALGMTVTCLGKGVFSGRKPASVMTVTCLGKGFVRYESNLSRQGVC